MFRRVINAVLAMIMLTVLYHGQALAVTTGTADGTYDFAGLGADDSSGPGYAKLGDKFRVGNSTFSAWRNHNTGPYSAVYPDATTTLPYTAIIKAEGGAICKTFTFHDLGISATTGSQKFNSLDIVLKDINGVQIGSSIILGASPVYADTSVTNISTLYSRAPWAVTGVASIEITFTLSVDDAPANAWFLNLENISIANVAAPVSTPIVSGINPSNGPVSGGTAVTISGVDFTGVTSVAFGGTAATGYTVNSPTQITATSPVGSAGTVDITVSTTSGVSATGGFDRFTYTALPTITGISPAVGSISGGESVIITGFNFTGATAVSFGGTAAANYVVNSSTRITATSPPGSPGLSQIIVTAPSGTSAPASFGYTALPAISGISPRFGSTGGGIPVVISGTNFAAATSVTFGNGFPAASYTVNSNTQITAVTPHVSSPATVNIAVTTPTGTSAISLSDPPADQFTFNNATGTVDGTYDFGGLGTDDSAGAGFTRLGDKFKVNNDQFGAFSSSLYTGALTTIYPNWDFTSSHTTVISAEGGLSCKMFTFKDLGISAIYDQQKFDSLDIVLRNINGDVIYTRSLGGSPNFNNTTITSLSSLYPSAGPWSIKGADGAVKGVDGVSTIELTYTISEGGFPTLASNLTLENITIANVETQLPVVTGISPANGLSVGGTTVTIEGDNFIGVSAVKFGGTDAAGFTVVSPTRITAISPAGGAGPADITVTSSLGTGATSPAGRFTFDLSPQIITFGPAPAINFPGTGTVAVTVTSGLIPTVSSTTPHVCSVSGPVVTSVASGTCIITADQPGNGFYSAAPQVTINFSVGKGDQAISFGTVPVVNVGGTATLGAILSSGLTATFTSKTPAVCTVTGTIVTGTAVGSCTIAADQPGDANYNAAPQGTQTFNIGKGNQTISFGPVPTLIVGGTGTVSATTTSGLQAVFSSATPAVCTVSDATVTRVVSGTCIIIANQPGDSNYNPAPQVTQNLSKANQDITFGTAPGINVGTTGTVSATASSGLPPTFESLTPAVCTAGNANITGVTAGTCTIACNQSGNNIYNAASQVTQSFNIGKGNQVISYHTIPVVFVGGSGTVSATATSGLDPVFTSATPQICTVTGSTVTGVTAGTCTIAANQSGSVNYNGAPEVMQSFKVVSPLPQITLSTLDDGAVSSVATVNIAGTLITPNGLKKLTVNDTDITGTVSTGGIFSSPVTLVRGKNTITVVATDSNDLVSSVTRNFTLDATAPLITLSGDQTDNSVTNNSHITIGGSVDNPATVVKSSINGGTPEAATMSGTGFSLPVTLSNGLNTIVITATDTSGKSSSIKQSIVLDNAIFLAITAPAQDLKSGMANFILTGTVKGTAPLTVSVVMDGQSFTPALTDGIFTQTLTFAAEKKYPIVVTAHDGNGNSVSVTRTVSYAWLGDSDGSGTADLSDVLNAYQISEGLKKPSATDLSRCDVAPLDANGKPAGNGVIDLGDVILLLRNRIGLVNW